MVTRVVVFDDNPDRLRTVATLLANNNTTWDVSEIPVDPHGSPDGANKLTKFTRNRIDLIVGYLYGSPSAKEILQAYKATNHGGRAVLYSHTKDISLNDFEDYKTANYMVQFDPAADPQATVNLVKKANAAMGERGIYYWVNLLASGKFWGGLGSAFVAGAGLATAIVNYYTPAAGP